MKDNCRRQHKKSSTRKHEACTTPCQYFVCNIGNAFKLNRSTGLQDVKKIYNCQPIRLEAGLMGEGDLVSLQIATFGILVTVKLSSNW